MMVANRRAVQSLASSCAGSDDRLGAALALAFRAGALRVDCLPRKVLR